MANYKLQLRTHAEIFATREEALEYINYNQGQVLLGEPTVFFYGNERKPSVILAIGNKDNTGGNGKVSIIDAGSIDGDKLNNLELDLNNLVEACGLTRDTRMMPGYQIVYKSDKPIIRTAESIAQAVDMLADKVSEIQPISEEGYNDISNNDNNNIIGLWNGLYAAVNLEYNPDTKKLIFKTSGKDSNGTFKTDAKINEIDLSGLGTAGDYETVANAEIEYGRLDGRIDSIHIVKDDNSDYQYKLMVDNQERSAINIPVCPVKLDAVKNENDFLKVGDDGLYLTGVSAIRDNVTSLQGVYSVLTGSEGETGSVKNIAKSYADGAKQYAEQVSKLTAVNPQAPTDDVTRFGVHFDINNNVPANKTIEGFVNVKFPELDYDPASNTLTYNGETIQLSDSQDTFINGASYDAENNQIILTYANPQGQQQLTIPLARLTNGLASKEDVDNIKANYIGNVTVAPSDNLSVNISRGANGNVASITLDNNASNYVCTLDVQGLVANTTVQDAIDYLNTEKYDQLIAYIDNAVATMNNKISELETRIDNIIAGETEDVSGLRAALEALTARVTALEDSEDFNNDGEFNLHNVDDHTDDTATF